MVLTLIINAPLMPYLLKWTNLSGASPVKASSPFLLVTMLGHSSLDQLCQGKGLEVDSISMPGRG